VKQRLAHELREFASIFLFIAPWFLAFSTYRMLLLRRFTEQPFEYGIALLNALILTKVIMAGQYLHLGKRHENKPLIYPTIWKSLLFSLLAAAFKVVEYIVRSILRGGGFAGGVASLHAAGAGEILGRSLVMFFAFIPFFALKETGRVLGEGKLAELFLGAKPRPAPLRPLKKIA
jgi:hypothetical protein